MENLKQEVKNEIQPPQTATQTKIDEPELINVEYIILGWIGLMVLGLMFGGLGSALATNQYFSFIQPFLITASNFIIVYPGPIIFAIIVGTIIGREIGKKSKTLEKAVRSGFINGFYSSVIYLLAVIIAYIVLSYFNLLSWSTLFLTVVQNVVMPVLVLTFTIVSFASISHIRKINL